MDKVELNTLRELLNELVKEYERISFNRGITKWGIYHSKGDFVSILQGEANDYTAYTAQLSLLNKIINKIADKIDMFVIDTTNKIYNINENESIQYRVLRVVEVNSYEK